MIMLWKNRLVIFQCRYNAVIFLGLSSVVIMLWISIEIFLNNQCFDIPMDEQCPEFVM